MTRRAPCPLIVALLATTGCAQGGERGATADSVASDSASANDGSETLAAETADETATAEEHLCTVTQGTWHADTGTCACPVQSGWTDANGCTTCTVACAESCDNLEDGEVCGVDRHWWCPCELSCMGVAQAASRLDCCDPVPSNCVPTCRDDSAGNCQSGTDARGCPRLDWTWQTCGPNESCVADFATNHAACVPLCDPPAECQSGCNQGTATTCHAGTDESGCATVRVEATPCGGMACTLDPATGSPGCSDPCTAEQATLGAEVCDRAWGYRWDGSGCTYLQGACPCTGKDCEHLHGTENSCMAAHAICTAATSDAVRCTASHGSWDLALGCDCGEGGAWDAHFGCWPARQLLCDATGGVFAPAFCGPFCGECACPEGTSWDAAAGCGGR